MATELPTQAAAFIAARHLTYYGPGLHIRQLVPTGTGLRAWLSSAIRLIRPFLVAADLEPRVVSNVAALEPVVSGPARDQLANAVTKLLPSGAIDLKKWVASVDLTADRAAFLVSHHIEIAGEMIRASDEPSAAVPHRDRVRELSLFAVGQPSFDLRRWLGITIDAG